MAEKILIVDDDLDTLRLVGLLLERQGFQIAAADNGKQGLAKAQEESPDLILLDVMMPDIDGFEVARRLRAIEATADIPIIFFTAKTQVEDKVAGFELGADDYLTKPVHPKELSARVHAILSRVGKSRTRVEQPSAPRGKIIGLLSARGGIGLTTMALNLGIILHHDSGEEVIVAEIRPGQGTISLDLGYPNPTAQTQLLQRQPEEITEGDVENALFPHSSGIQLFLSSSQPSDAQYLPAVPQFERIVQFLGRLAAFTLLDLGPGIPPVTEKLLDQCDQIVVVVEPDPGSVAHTKALLDDLSLRVLGLDRINVAIVSRVRSDLKLTRSQIQDQLGHTVSNVFTPVPELAYQAARAKLPLVLFQAGAGNTQQHNNLQQYKTLAQAIVTHGQKIRT